jgi:hypothetical protein
VKDIREQTISNSACLTLNDSTSCSNDCESCEGDCVLHYDGFRQYERIDLMSDCNDC